MTRVRPQGERVFPMPALTMGKWCSHSLKCLPVSFLLLLFGPRDWTGGFRVPARPTQLFHEHPFSWSPTQKPASHSCTTRRTSKASDTQKPVSLEKSGASACITSGEFSYFTPISQRILKVNLVHNPSMTSSNSLSPPFNYSHPLHSENSHWPTK